MFSELSPGSPFWKPAGMAIWNALTRSLARGEPGARLSRGENADPLRRRAVEAVRALGQVQGQHVLHRRRGPPDGPEADELPGPHPDLQRRAPLLSRPAGALLRGGPRAPPRAERRPARAAAGAPHHPGRRPHLLHRGAGRGGGRAVPALRLRPLSRCSASSRAWSSRPGPSSASAATRCGTAPRPRWRARSRARAWSTS